MKHVLLLLCLSATIAQAQIHYEREISHQFTLGVSDALTLSNGDILLSAYAYPPQFDSAFALLIKLDSTLQMKWAKRYKALRKDDFNCLTQLSDGNILVGGTMRQDFAQEVGGTVLKMDTAGNVIWSKVYSANNDDRTLAMFERADGTMMVFVRHGVSNQPTKIILTDSAGGIIGSRTYFDGTRGIFGEAVTQDDNEIYYLAGDLFNLTTGRWDLFVCAVDEHSMLWYKLYDMGRSVGCHNLEYSPTGHLVAGGNIRDTSTTNAYNLWMMKLDLQGNSVWAKELAQSQPYSEGIGAIQPLSNGDVLGFGQAGTAAGSDGLTFKLDGTGNLLWAKGFNHYVGQGTTVTSQFADGRLFITAATFGNQVYLLTASEMGEVACSGSTVSLTASSLSVDSVSPAVTPGNPSIDADTHAIVITPATITSNLICEMTVGVAKPEVEENLALYPVPCHDRLTIVLPADLQGKEVQLQITDVLGRRVRTVVMDGTGEIHLSVDDLDPGMYWMEVASGDHRVTGKFVKM